MSIFNREETELDKKVKIFQREELEKKRKTLLQQKKALLVERKEKEEFRQLKKEVGHLTNERRFAPLYGAAREGKRVYHGFQNMAKKTPSRRSSGNTNRGLDWGSGSNMSLGLGGLQESKAGHSLMSGFGNDMKSGHTLSFGHEPERRPRHHKKTSGHHKTGKTIVIKLG